MDHVVVLMNQHKSIRNLLKAAQKSGTVQERTGLLDRLRSEIDLHTYLEESQVYPVLEDYDSLKSQVYGLWQEHERLRQELQSALSVHQDERAFQARLSRLRQLFEEHMREEEVHIYPNARKLLSPDLLERLERNLQSIQKDKFAA
jgi:hemerythrin-like domain-containing protein